MHDVIKNKIERNAAYHSAMAEYYTNLKKPPAEPEVEEVEEEGEEPVDTGDVGGPPAKPVLAPGEIPEEQLDRLIEMHSEAAKNLTDLLANAPKQVILQELASQRVLRKEGTIRFASGQGPLQATMGMAPTRH